MPPYPEWLHVLSWTYLSLSFICTAVIIGDEVRRPQKMMIMNLHGTLLGAGGAKFWANLRG